MQSNTNKRVAVIGAGPAGITCAYKLLLGGIKVDVLMLSKRRAAWLRSVFRVIACRRTCSKRESEDIIRQLGGNFLYSKVLGGSFTVDELLGKGYDAVFLAYGASQRDPLRHQE